MKKNSEFQWEEFSPQTYFESNYRSLHRDDKKIITHLQSFLASKPRSRTMLDIGSGSSFVPCLTAIPYADKITLSDFSYFNCHWLKDQIASTNFSQNWSEALEYLGELAVVYDRRRILDRLSKVLVEEQSVFELPQNRYDLCTMFFCIESATNSSEEFAQGLKRFLNAPISGGIFFAVMMRNSNGYTVGGINFPAYKFAIDELKNLVKAKSDEFEVIEIDASTPLIRDGYDGYVIIQGKTN